MLKALQEKSEAPDAPSVGRSISVQIDLGDAKQVALAQRHGFLDPDEDESDKEAPEGDTKDADEKPKRRGYFQES